MISLFVGDQKSSGEANGGLGLAGGPLGCKDRLYIDFIPPGLGDDPC